MAHITSRLTAKNRDQLQNPTLGNRVWVTFTFFTVSNRSVQLPKTGERWGGGLELLTRLCARSVAHSYDSFRQDLKTSLVLLAYTVH